MIRTHITSDELDSDDDPTEAVALDDIKVSQCFITVDNTAVPHSWPVYQKTATGYIRLEDEASTPHFLFERYRIRRLKAELHCHQSRHRTDPSGTLD